jgi:hypothetical protein
MAVDPNAGLPNGAEREFEIGEDEGYKAKLLSESGILFANAKRTYDEFQQESLETMRRSRDAFNKLTSDAQTADNQIRLVALQALQNAVKVADLSAMQTLRHTENVCETSNKDGKQATRHADIAIDQQWNPVQQGVGDTLTARSVSIDDASLKAIGAMIAQAMAALMPAQVATGGAPATK